MAVRKAGQRYAASCLWPTQLPRSYRQHGRFLLRRPAQHPPCTVHQGSCEETVDRVRSYQWLRCVGGKGLCLELDLLNLAAVRWSALRLAVQRSQLSYRCKPSSKLHQPLRPGRHAHNARLYAPVTGAGCPRGLILQRSRCRVATTRCARSDYGAMKPRYSPGCSASMAHALRDITRHTC